MKFEAGIGFALWTVARLGVSIGYLGLGSLGNNSMQVATYANLQAAIIFGSSSVTQFYLGHNTEGSHIWTQYASSTHFFSIGLDQTVTPTAKLHIRDTRDGSADRIGMLFDTSAAAWTNLSKLADFRMAGVSKFSIGPNGTPYQIKPASFNTVAGVTTSTIVMTLAENRHYIFHCFSAGKQGGNAGSIKAEITASFHRYIGGGAVLESSTKSKYFYSSDLSDIIEFDVSGNDVVIKTTTSVIMAVQHYINFEINTL